MPWIYIWVGVLALALIIEFVTVELVSVWVAVGAFFGLILAACGVRYEIVIAVVVVVSIGSIFGLRPVAMKLMRKGNLKTNAENAVGKQVRLLSGITADELGSFKLNGTVWSAKSENDKPIKKDSWVEIVSIEGNKYVVKKINKKEGE